MKREKDQKREQKKDHNKGWKRLAAATLALLLAMGGMDLSGFAVNAKTDEEAAAAETELLITAFAGLDKEITEQQLPVGASQEDIVFPETLTVTVKQLTVAADTEEQEAYQSTEESSDTEEQEAYQSTEESSDTEEQSSDTEAAEATEETDTDAEGVEKLLSALTPMKVCAAEGTKTQLTLTGITWKLNPEESDGDTFDSSADSNGKCYTYVPVLPDTDADGNRLQLAEDTELPMIYVLIGERGVMPLKIETNTEETTTGGGAAVTYKENVKLAEGASVTVNGTLTYGEPLSKLGFNAVKFVDSQGNNEVAGTLAWNNPSTKPDANTDMDGKEITGKTTEFDWTFTPADTTTYETATGKAAVTVYPAMPTVENIPDISACSYEYKTNSAYAVQDIFDRAGVLAPSVKDINGQELTSIKWQWKNEENDPPSYEEKKNFGVGSFTWTVSGTVQNNNNEENTNYQRVEFPLVVNVTKATPIVTGCSVSAYMHGEFLRDKELTAIVTDGAGTQLLKGISYEIVWKEPDRQLSYADNGKEFEYICVSINSNYNNVVGEVQITVNKQSYPPNKPAGTMNVSKSCATVGAISLPTGWAWRDSDKNTELTEGGTAVNVTAEYTGADKDNYEYTTVAVDVTRSDCEHEECALITDTAPKCTTEGTGHTVCSKCSQEVRNNITIPATGHNYQRREPNSMNMESTEFQYYECSVCHDIYKTAAASTSTEGSSTGTGSGGSGSSESSGGSGSSESSSDSGSSDDTGTAATVTPASQDKSREPFITSDTGAQGWAAIREYVQNAEEGSVIMVSMNDTTVVPADIMELIRGKAVMLAFDMGDGTAWVVSGLLMTAATEGIPTVVYYEDELQGKLLFTIMTLTAEETPVPVYYADFNKGTLTPADTAVMKTDAMQAYLYAYGQKCFAFLCELGQGKAQNP